MATSYTGLRVQDTYNAIIKIGDNSNLTATPKLLSDGLGNDSPLYLSGTRLGIGISPAYQFHTSGNAKIGGNLIISGNLTVNGTLTYLNVEDLAVEDPLIKLAKDNTANTLDIGLFGKYVATGTKYKGFFNDASDDKFKLFIGTTVEPGTTVDTSASGYTKGNLVIGNLEATGGDFSDTVYIDDHLEIENSSGYGYIELGGSSGGYIDLKGPFANDFDLRVFTDGTNSQINAIAGSLDITANSGIDLQYQGSNKLTVISTGIDVTGNLFVSGGIKDSDGDLGTSGQLLSSTGTGTNWIDFEADVAKRIDVTVKNVSGGSLAKGVVVHAAPTATPPSGNVIEVIAADANDAAKMPAIGVLNETIADEAEGEAVMFGAVSGIDTSSFSIGDELYVSETAGAFTATKPTAFTSEVQKIAVVIKSHASNGLIKVFGAGRSNDVPNRVDRDMNFTDDSELTFGDSSDLKIYHTTNNIVRINSGDLIFNSFVTDGDIKFQLDDGGTSVTEYMRLDGGSQNIVITQSLDVNNLLTISNTNAPALILKDSGDSGQSANPYINFVGSDDTRVGYIGMGSSGNSRLYLEGDDGIYTNNPLTVQGELNVNSNGQEGLIHTGARDGAIFNRQKNTSDGDNAYVSRLWQNDTGFGEIWRNSSNRSSAGQPALSFNMYNSDDINFWSGGSLTLTLSGNNASLVGNMNSEGYTINSATLQSFQDFQSKPIDTDSGMFTVGGHGMNVGYSRAVSLWSTTDGTWKSWVGTNLRWDGTNYLRASNAQNENWGNIAGLLFWGNAASYGKAIEFIIDPPENATGAGEATIGTSLPSGYTALTIDNDLSANFSGNVSVSGTTSLTGNLSVSDSARFEGTTTPITIGDGFGYGGSATICKRNAALYLQYNNGQTATQLNIGGGGTAVDIVDVQNSNYRLNSDGHSYVGNSAGNFGVGESTPTRGITIKKANEFASLNIIKSGTTNQIVFLGTGSSGASDDLGILQLSDSGSVKVQMYSGGMSYLNGGSLVIGGTTTSAKFEVIGNTKLWSRWNSGTLSDNSFYVQNSTDGFAFGIGTGVSSWFSWDNSAGQKRAIDVWNNGTQILLGAGGAKVTVGDAGLNSALNVRGQSGDSFGNYGYVCLTLEHPDNYPAMVFRHGDNGHLIRHDNNNKLQIVGGADSGTLIKKMQFETNGSVLIGTGVGAFQTATNNTGLTVDTGGHSSIQIGDGVNDGGMIQSSDNSQRIIIGANVYDSPTGSWQRFTADSAALVDVYGEGTGSFISLNVDAGTSGFPTARLVVTNNGYIGMGIDNPGTNLHIKKSGAGTILRLQQSAANSYAESQWQTPTGSMYIFVNSSTYTSYGGANATNFYSSNGSFNFHTNSGNNLLVVKNDGKVGVNVLNPGTTMHVQTTAVAGLSHSYYGSMIIENSGESAMNIIGTSYSSIYFGDAASAFSGAIVYNHSSNLLDFRVNTQDTRMKINAGAETVSLYAVDDTGDNYIQFRKNSGAAQGYIGYGASADNTLYIVQQSANNIQFYNGSATRMALTTSGYVGIGQEWTSPTAPLDVKGVRMGRDWNLSGRATIRIDSNGSSYPSDILFADNAAGTQGTWAGVKWSFSSRHGDADNKFYIYRGSGHASPYNSEAVLMSFTKDLKVGINQASPSYALDVTGDGRFTTQVRAPRHYAQSVASSTWPFLLDTAAHSGTNASGFWVNSDGTPDMRLRRDNGTVRVLLNSNTSNSYFNSGGNYGFGTTAPASRVDISGKDDAFNGWGYVSLTLRNENNYPAMVFRHGSYGTLIRQDNGYNLQIANGTTSGLTKRFQLNHSNGFVSLGNINPSYALDVSGTIRASADVIAYSDKRVKENIVTINNALEKVTKLRGVSYNRKDTDDKSKKIGVIAQEVLDVVPEIVQLDDNDRYSVAYGNMAGLFIEAIKDLKSEINDLKQQIKELKK